MQKQKKIPRIKDKSIRIFREDQTQEGIIKIYIHPENTFLKAYVRQLSTSELLAFNAVLDGSAIEFTINFREISPTMFVEFRGKTYQIGPADRFEFYDRELKFIGYEITPRDDYIKIEYEEWKKWKYIMYYLKV